MQLKCLDLDWKMILLGDGGGRSGSKMSEEETLEKTEKHLGEKGDGMSKAELEEKKKKKKNRRRASCVTSHKMRSSLNLRTTTSDSNM